MIKGSHPDAGTFLQAGELARFNHTKFSIPGLFPTVNLTKCESIKTMDDGYERTPSPTAVMAPVESLIPNHHRDTLNLHRHIPTPSNRRIPSGLG